MLTTMNIISLDQGKIYAPPSDRRDEQSEVDMAASGRLGMGIQAGGIQAGVTLAPVPITKIRGLETGIARSLLGWRKLYLRSFLRHGASAR
jgi:hypothetical protein